MYIKMGISMELEEVPEKLIEYLSDAEDNLLAKSGNLKNSLKQRVIDPGVITEINSIKKELSKFEQVLQDCSEVITSYNEVMLQQKAAYLERMGPQEPPTVPLETDR